MTGGPPFQDSKTRDGHEWFGWRGCPCYVLEDMFHRATMETDLLEALGPNSHMGFVVLCLGTVHPSSFALWSWDKWYDTHSPNPKWNFAKKYVKGSNGS